MNISIVFCIILVMLNDSRATNCKYEESIRPFDSIVTYPIEWSMGDKNTWLTHLSVQFEIQLDESMSVNDNSAVFDIEINMNDLVVPATNDVSLNSVSDTFIIINSTIDLRYPLETNGIDIIGTLARENSPITITSIGISHCKARLDRVENVLSLEITGFTVNSNDKNEQDLEKEKAEVTTTINDCCEKFAISTQLSCLFQTAIFKTQYFLVGQTTFFFQTTFFSNHFFFCTIVFKSLCYIFVETEHDCILVIFYQLKVMLLLIIVII